MTQVSTQATSRGNTSTDCVPCGSKGHDICAVRCLHEMPGIQPQNILKTAFLLVFVINLHRAAAQAQASIRNTLAEDFSSRFTVRPVDANFTDLTSEVRARSLTGDGECSRCAPLARVRFSLESALLFPRCSPASHHSSAPFLCISSIYITCCSYCCLHTLLTAHLCHFETRHSPCRLQRHQLP